MKSRSLLARRFVVVAAQVAILVATVVWKLPGAATPVIAVALIVLIVAENRLAERLYKRERALIALTARCLEDQEPAYCKGLVPDDILSAATAEKGAS